MDFHRIRVVSFDKKGIEEDSYTKKQSNSKPLYVNGHAEKMDQKKISKARKNKTSAHTTSRLVHAIDANNSKNRRPKHNSKAEVLKVPYKNKLAKKQKRRKFIRFNGLKRTFSFKSNLCSKYKKNSQFDCKKVKHHHKKCKKKGHHTRNKEVMVLFTAKNCKLNRGTRKDLPLKHKQSFDLPNSYYISKSSHHMFGLQKSNSSRNPHTYCQFYDNNNTNWGFLKLLKKLYYSQHNVQSRSTNCLLVKSESHIKLGRTKTEVIKPPVHNKYKLVDFFESTKNKKLIKQESLHFNVMNKGVYAHNPGRNIATGTSQSGLENALYYDTAVGEGDCDCTNDLNMGCACVHDENFINHTNRIQNCSIFRYILIGTIVIAWSPCILVMIIIWSITYRLRHNTQKAPNNQSKNTFWSSFKTWITNRTHSITNSIPNKSKKQTSAYAYPNRRRTYTLFYVHQRGWMIKPICEKIRKYKLNKKNISGDFQDPDRKHSKPSFKEKLKTCKLKKFLFSVERCKKRFSLKARKQNTTLKFNHPDCKCQPRASCESLTHLKELASKIPSVPPDFEAFKAKHQHSGCMSQLVFGSHDSRLKQLTIPQSTANLDYSISKKFPIIGPDLGHSGCMCYSDGNCGCCYANQSYQIQSATKPGPDCSGQSDKINIGSNTSNPHARHTILKKDKTGDLSIKHHHKRIAFKSDSPVRPLDHSISKMAFQCKRLRNYRESPCAKFQIFGDMHPVDKLAHQKPMKDRSDKNGLNNCNLNDSYKLFKGAKTGGSRLKHYPKQCACTCYLSSRRLHHSNFKTPNHQTHQKDRLAKIGFNYRGSWIKLCKNIKTNCPSLKYHKRQRSVRCKCDHSANFESHQEFDKQSICQNPKLIKCLKSSCLFKKEKLPRTLCQKSLSLCRVCNFSVREIDNDMWKSNLSCRDMYIHTLEHRPCFWVYKYCPKYYPLFLKIYRISKQFAHMMSFCLSLCFWCPIALFCFICYHGCFKCLF